MYGAQSVKASYTISRHNVLEALGVSDERNIHKIMDMNNEWIPVEERLPNNCRDVWVTVKNRDGICYVTQGRYEPENEMWRTHKNVTVLAWKPYYVPEPYKPEK